MIKMTPEERAAAMLGAFHTDCLCEHEDWLVASTIRAAIAEEREACAKILDRRAGDHRTNEKRNGEIGNLMLEQHNKWCADILEQGAAAIRARAT